MWRRLAALSGRLRAARASRSSGRRCGSRPGDERGAGDPRPASRRVERARARLRSDRVNLLRRIAEVPPSITDGAFPPDGHAFVLRDYSAAHLFAAPGRQVVALPLPLQRQGVDHLVA